MTPPNILCTKTAAVVSPLLLDSHKLGIYSLIGMSNMVREMNVLIYELHSINYL